MIEEERTMSPQELLQAFSQSLLAWREQGLRTVVTATVSADDCELVREWRQNVESKLSGALRELVYGASL